MRMAIGWTVEADVAAYPRLELEVDVDTDVDVSLGVMLGSGSNGGSLWK